MSITIEKSSTKLTKGYADNSVNATSFRKNAITTAYFGKDKYQYASYYDVNGEVVLARRVNDDAWEFSNTGLKAPIRDAHNVISMAIDGNGIVHLAWSDHAGEMTYAHTDKPHSMSPHAAAMIGSLEESVTYPEFYNLENGDLLFLYRNGSSGRGDLVLNRYMSDEGRWVRLHDNLICGEGRLSPYWQATLDYAGRLHISWVWRETPDVRTNFNMNYAVSDDSFTEFYKSTGEKYSLPITESSAEVIKEIPQGRVLINQTSMTVDDNNVPYIVSYWREQNAVQYHIFHLDRGEWKCENTNLRNKDFELSSVGTRKIPIARPQIAVDGSKEHTAVMMLIRDEERGEVVSIAVFGYERQGDRLKLLEYTDITDYSVGVWEPNYDISRWKHERVLSSMVQRCYYSTDTQINEIVRDEDVRVFDIKVKM